MKINTQSIKVAIIGTRQFNDYTCLAESVEKLVNANEISHIISGGAKGADTIAHQYALDKSIPTIIYNADWDKYGRAAGPVRNKQIVNSADIVIAFWDGKSKGTLSSINIAKKTNKILHVIRYDII